MPASISRLRRHRGFDTRRPACGRCCSSQSPSVRQRQRVGLLAEACRLSRRRTAWRKTFLESHMTDASTKLSLLYVGLVADRRRCTGSRRWLLLAPRAARRRSRCRRARRSSARRPSSRSSAASRISAASASPSVADLCVGDPTPWVDAARAGDEAAGRSVPGREVPVGAVGGDHDAESSRDRGCAATTPAM